MVSSFLAVFSSVVASSTARAAERASKAAAEAISVRILESDPCFSSRRFLSQVRSRLKDRRFSITFEPADVEVQVVQAERGYAAQLRIKKEDGSQLSRAITAASCGEAIDGLAFITSVALDANAIDPASAPEQPAALESAPREGADEYRGVLAAGATSLFLVLPRAAFGPEASFQWGQERGGWWSPAASLGIQMHRLPNVREPSGTARFELLQATLELCPSQWKYGFFSIRPCAYGSAGRLRAEGRATQNPGERRRPYLSAGGDVLLDFELGQVVHLLARGMIALPMVRDSFQFDGVTFHRVEVLSYGFGASLGFELF